MSHFPPARDCLDVTMEKGSEHELLSRFVQQHDDGAFRELVQRYLGLVMGTAMRITGHQPLGEEVAQDVFALLAARAGVLQRGRAPLAVWLLRTARFKALRALTREQRRARHLEKLMSETSAFTEVQERWEPLLPHLDAAIERLSSAEREVLLLHYYERLPHATIAGRLGISPEAVRQRSSRAVERLAKFLRARHGAPVTPAFLAAGLCVSLTGPAPAALVAGVSQSALVAAGSVKSTAILSNILQTMNTTQTAAIAITALCLAAISWQEVTFASTSRKIESLRMGEPDRRALPLAAYQSGQGRKTLPASWERQLDELEAGRLTPEALTEFARRIKRVRVDGDLSATRGLAQFAGSLDDSLLLDAVEMSLHLDLSAEEKSELWNLLLSSLGDQPECLLSLAARAWQEVPETMRDDIRKTACQSIREWSRTHPDEALNWYRTALAANTLAKGQPKAELAGALLTGLKGKSMQAARDFFTSLPVEDRGPALGATVANTKSSAVLLEFLNLAGDVPEQDRAAPLARIAARIAQSTSLAEAGVIFDSISFPDTASRAQAAREMAVASAINKNATSSERQNAAWEWLSGHSAGESQRSVQAEFLSAVAGNDPAWALERFESISGSSQGEELLLAFLKKIPGGDSHISERYFDLATRVTDPVKQEAILAKVWERWKQVDPVAASHSLDTAALPGGMKDRIRAVRN